MIHHASRFAASGLECRRGRRRLFQDLSLALAPGRMLQVAGRNGSGKSTLLRALCGLTRPERGSITWNEVSIVKARDDFNAMLTYVGHASGLKDDLDPVENVEAALDVAGRALDRTPIREALIALGLEGCLGLASKLLSQGQRRRVALARLWLSAASPLWILDEPFVALDAESTEALRLLLTGHLERGGILVLTTHQEIEIAPLRTVHLRLDA